MDFIAAFGLIVGIAVMIVLTFRGHHIFVGSLTGGAIVILTNRINAVTALTEGYLTSLAGFVQSFLFMFLFGAILGQFMSESGAAKAIAYKVIDIFGKSRAILILVLVTAVLTYGGVSVFVVIFSVYPIALYLFKEADIPKRLIPGAVNLGGGTFTMTCLPGTPALTNVIPTQYLGTTTTAAPVLGIICGVTMFILGMLYLTWEAKRLKGKGMTFVAGEGEVIGSVSEEERKTLPSFFLSVLPIIIIFITNVSGPKLLGLNANFSVSLGLLLAVFYCYLVFRNRYTDVKGMITKGSQGAIMALVNTAAIVGFGGIVKIAPAFESFVNMAAGLPFSPIVSMILGVNIVAGITGSSSGGLTIFYNTMAEKFMADNINVQVFHRISSIAAGCLDSLPHAGPNITILNVTKLSYAEGYYPIFVITCVIPIITVTLATILATLGVV